jgi:hypothetical protein
MDAEYLIEALDSVSQLCFTVTSCRHQTHASYPPVIVTFGNCISLRLNDVLTGCFVIFSQLTKQINLHCSCDSVLPNFVAKMAYIAVLYIAVPCVSITDMHVRIGQTYNCNEYWESNFSGHTFTYVSLNAI